MRIAYYQSVDTGLGLGRHCFYVIAVQGQTRSTPGDFCWQCKPIRVNGGFTIGGNARNLFYPGTSEPLDLAITNPFKFAIKVLSVSVRVEPVPALDGVPDPACPAATNMLVTRPLGATLAVPARSTKSLSDLGVPQAQWPVLTMPDLPSNQDACEGATFTLLYSGTATMGTPSPVPTWTAVVSSPDPSSLGHAVTLTAIVAKSPGPDTPTGSVSFYLASPTGPHDLLGTSSLNASARATWTTSGLGAGSHSLFAVYTGGTNFAASTSPLIAQLIIASRENINGDSGTETSYVGTGTHNTHRSAANHTDTCNVPTPPSSFHGSPAAYDHDTSIGCTAVAS